MTEITRHHLDFVADVVGRVRRHGAAEALGALRAERPAVAGHGYHDTRTVFTVWAVDRLLQAGLTDRAVLWHPLVHADSVYAWWTPAVVDSARAADVFVPSDRALPGEPAPSDTFVGLVAA